MKYFFLTLLVLGLDTLLMGQKTDIPLNGQEYSILDRWEIQSGTNLHLTVKPISRIVFAEAAKGNTSETAIFTYDKSQVLKECVEYSDSSWLVKGLWGTLYKNNSDFYSVSTKDFDFHLNPISVQTVGNDSRTSELIFQNYRGIEFRGTIDNKVSFYTLVNEDQARYPAYVRNMTDSTLGVPYEGFWKQYNVNGVDFLRAQGYVNFNVSKHINAQMGFGKHFIGNGTRSLILSDFGNNYPYLRLQTQIWKFQYTNIFAQLTGQTTGGIYGLNGIGSFSRKYLALHHLDLKVTKNLNVGLFESIIFGKPDSLGSNSWRMEYLNPVIFYRAVEQQDGSSDNALIGMDFKWNLFKSLSLYGQLLIDELVVSEAFSNSGWWGNKQGFQLGLKYFDAFSIKNLLIQVEANKVRPYVYAHESNYTSYSHYNMPLAHPLGANFQELLISAQYRIMPRMTVYGNILLAQYGNDQDSLSYGRDILKSYSLKTGEYGVDFLQGDKTSLFMTQARVSYQWYQQLFTDLEIIQRKETSSKTNAPFTSTVISLTLRYHFPYRSYLF